MTLTRRITAEIINLITHYAFAYGLLATLMLWLFEDPFYVWYMALIAIPFAINFFLRRVVKNMLLLILIHATVPAALVFILTMDMFGVLCVLIAVALAVHSISYAFGKAPTTNMSFIILSVMLYGTLSLWASYQGMLPLPFIYPLVLAVIIIGRTILLSMLQMDKSLNALQSQAKQPIEKILTFNYKLVAGLLATIIVMTVVLYFVLVAPTLRTAVGMFPGIPDFVPWEDDSQGYVDQLAQVPVGHELSELMGEPTPSIVWQIIGLLFRIVMTIALFVIGGVLIFAVLYYAPRAIFRFLSSSAPKKQGEVISQDMEDVREFIFLENIPKRKRPFWGKSKENPVRRLFRETVVKHIKKGVPIQQSDTPTEMSLRISAEDISKLADEYAQIRYKPQP